MTGVDAADLRMEKEDLLPFEQLIVHEDAGIKPDVESPGDGSDGFVLEVDVDLREDEIV
jgi:hypothetical protein